MKRIGLIGGVSPESTELYVRLFNSAARARLGGEHSASFVVWNLDYGRIISLYRERNWQGYIDEFVAAARGLKNAGVEALMIGSNTSHLTADAIAAATGVPVIHLQDALCAAMIARGVTRPLLTGTKLTMSGPFYRSSLAQRYNGEVETPTEVEQEEIERIIIDELCVGVVSNDSRTQLTSIIAAHPDCDGVILGCTELSLILTDGDCRAPVFDTTALHAAAGMAFAFEAER